MRIRGMVAVIFLVVAGGTLLAAKTRSSASNAGSTPKPQTNAQFFAAADQVLQVISKILHLPVKAR